MAFLLLLLMEMLETAPGYLEIHDIIYGYAQREVSGLMGVIELGDPRVRTAAGLKELAAKTFADSDINITPLLLSLKAAPDILAREAAGFFYASFVTFSKRPPPNAY